MYNPHLITAHFEAELARYCGSEFAICIDNQSNALFLALTWWRTFVDHGNTTFLEIPSHTYPSVPQEIRHAGYKVAFKKSSKMLTGQYQIGTSPVYDSALRFTCNMYLSGSLQCLSFTGPYKILSIGKGGAILTDNKKAYQWFKKARFSGRSECSYHEDDFDSNPVCGWNMYLLPELAAKGLQLMNKFYSIDGKKLHNEDLSLPYPDLSKFKLWK